MHPLRVGLAGLIDSAGLFPPAALDLPAVVANVQRDLDSPQGWMVGRLVVPLGSLDACAALITQSSEGGPLQRWTVSVLVQPGDALAAVETAVTRFNGRLAGHGVAAVAVEASAGTPRDVDAVAAQVPDTLERFVEVALGPGLDALLDSVAVRGCYAKVRTGGLTADRIPASADLARFIVACQAREVPFKATAGLHHPLRAPQRLTYEPDSASATMHGFVNILAAASLLHGRQIDPSRVVAVLDETDATRFAHEPGALRWGDASVGIAEIADCRAHLFRSVGSCSFEEPVQDLRRMGWLVAR